MTNTCTAKASSKHALMGAAMAALLAGCVNDSASYVIDDSDEHAITLLRAQNGFWQDTARLTIIATRMPDCRGGLSVEDVPLSATPELYEAPPDYEQPIYILKVEQQYYAVSTAQCRVQAFTETPQNPGTRLGVFQAGADGRLAFTKP